MRTCVRLRLLAGAVLTLTMALAADIEAQRPVAPSPRPKPDADQSLPAGAVARIGWPRLLLPGSVINVAFAPSGTTFVSTGDPLRGTKSTDRLLVLWDAVTGKEIRQFKGHTGGVQCAAFSANGKQMVTGSEDSSVRLWDVATGKQIREYRGHKGTVLCVAYSSDGKWLASEGKDATIRIWDTENNKEVRKWAGHTGRGTSNLRFSPDGKLLASVGADFAVRLWNPETGDLVKTFHGSNKESESLDFSPNGKELAAISEDGMVWVWEVATGNKVVSFPAHKGIGVTIRYSPDGSTLATGGDDGTIQFFALKGGMTRRIAPAHIGVVSEISYSADGTILASAGHDGSVKLWDVATASELPQSGGPVSRIALSPDGKRLATAGGSQVRFWDTATGTEQLPTLQIDQLPQTMAFAADGLNLVTSNSTDELRYWSLEPRKPNRQFGARTPNPINRLALDHGGRFVLMSGGGIVRLWDTGMGVPTKNVPFETAMTRAGPVRAAAFAPIGDRLAIASTDGKTRVWDVANWQEIGIVPLDRPTLHSHAIAWSPDGRSFATVQVAEWTLRIWEVVSGHERLTPIVLPSVGWSVAFSPDGRIVATGSTQGQLRLWDARTGKELARRVGHAGQITYLAFTPDGRFLVSASADVAIPIPKQPDRIQLGDGTAVVWDVAELVKIVPEVPRPGATDVEALWKVLQGPDAIKASNAIWWLAAEPALALPLLRERLPKFLPDTPNQQIEKLLADLDHDDFDVRENATKELIQLGPVAVRAVRQTLATTKSREVRRRAEEIISRAVPGPGTSTQHILIVRGVEILQRIGTPESRKLLETWADGPANSPLARESRIALGRPRK